MVDLPFEHAFGGGAFARAGRLVGDLDGQVNLEQARRNLFRCSSFGMKWLCLYHVGLL